MPNTMLIKECKNNILKTGSRIVSHFALAGPHSKI